MWDPEYESTHGCVTCQGRSAKDGPELRSFLQGAVSERLLDTEEQAELHALLRGLDLTGMGSEALERVLAADTPESRDWAAAEALAEAVLEAEHGVEFPWNHARDKRTPSASLPGADIIGFQREGDTYRLALGEVKCSSQAKSPPNVMLGRSGLCHQLDKLATDLSLIYQILSWLFSRVDGTPFLEALRDAMRRYLNSDNRDVALFGVLVRDRQPDALDLQSRGQTLGASLSAPSRCHLLALYLPFPIANLPQAIQPAVPL